MQKNLNTTLLFVDFSKAFDSIHRGMMEQIWPAYCLPKETVTAIMMLYRNKKAKVCSPDGNKVLQYCCWSFAKRYISTIFVYNLPKLWTLNVSRSNKRKWLYTKKGKKQMISCRNYNRLRLCRWFNTSCKYNCPSWIPTAHRLEQTVGGIGLHINTIKTEYMCFKREGAISTLNGWPLKLADKSNSSISNNSV